MGSNLECMCSLWWRMCVIVGSAALSLLHLSPWLTPHTTPAAQWNTGLIRISRNIWDQFGLSHQPNYHHVIPPTINAVPAKHSAWIWHKPSTFYTDQYLCGSILGISSQNSRWFRLSQFFFDGNLINVLSILFESLMAENRFWLVCGCSGVMTVIIQTHFNNGPGLDEKQSCPTYYQHDEVIC